MFSVIVMLCSLATGIASAIFASEWGKPPEACAQANVALDQDNVCDSIQLTVTNAIQSVSVHYLKTYILADAAFPSCRCLAFCYLEHLLPQLVWQHSCC